MRKLLLLSAALLAAGLMIFIATSRSGPRVTELSQAEFISKFQSNLIARLQVSWPPQPPALVQEVRGTFYETDSTGRLLLENGAPKQSRFHSSFYPSETLNRQLMTHTNYSVVTLNPVAQKLKDSVSGAK